MKRGVANVAREATSIDPVSEAGPAASPTQLGHPPLAYSVQHASAEASSSTR